MALLFYAGYSWLSERCRPSPDGGRLVRPFRRWHEKYDLPTAGHQRARQALSDLANEYTRVKILFTDSKNKPIAAQIARLFETAGWKTEFVSVPVPSDQQIDGVEVKGYNKVFADQISTILSAAGVTQTVSAGIEYKEKKDSPKWQGQQCYIRISVGYNEPSRL
jgi:hypothetical protein